MYRLHKTEDAESGNIYKIHKGLLKTFPKSGTLTVSKETFPTREKGIGNVFMRNVST
jgi:hypothetical protein